MREITRQQEAVLRLIWDGMSQKEMSEALKISTKTVGYHITNLFDEFGVDNRISLVRRALAEGNLRVTAKR